MNLKLFNTKLPRNGKDPPGIVPPACQWSSTRALHSFLITTSVTQGNSVPVHSETDYMALGIRAEFDPLLFGHKKPSRMIDSKSKY